jgi:signal transduction histidine kinase
LCGWKFQRRIFKIIICEKGSEALIKKLKQLLQLIKKIFTENFWIQIILIIILSTIGAKVSYNFYRNNGFQYLHKKSMVVESKFYPVTDTIDRKLAKYTNYLNDISEDKIKEEDFEKHDFQTNNKTPLVQFVVVNNRNKKVYWNYWTLANIKIYDGDNYKVKNIEDYIRKISSVYHKIPYKGYDIPGPKDSKDNLVVQDITIYYWLDKRDIFSMDFINDIYNEINAARKQFIFIIVWLIILTVFLVSKIIYIKNIGRKKALENMKVSINNLKLSLYSLIDKFSIEGTNKKAGILFGVAILVYLIDYYIKVGYDNSILYFIKKIFYWEYPYLIFFMFFLSIIFLLTLRKLKYFNNILDNTEEIAKGNLSLKLTKSAYGDLNKMVECINSIRDAYEKTIQDRMKNERLKTELISNVSHDLKTPLTSILTYANLLQRKNLTEEEKENYIDIVDRKTKKLNILMDDLFEVSILNSGKIQLNKEKIDIVELIYQVIGEWSGYYKEKNIKFKINTFSEEVILNIDGKRMSRLIDNLVSNALKYSLSDTRVYIDIEKHNNKIIISLKNISEYDMDFDTDEIFERFKRGDKSRNSKIQGSGLGLAIAKGIAELHNGGMYIDKEGDLFKVYLILNEDKDFHEKGLVTK